MLVEGDQDETVQLEAGGQYLVPLAVRVVPQLLLWVKEVPEHLVLVEGDQDETVQLEAGGQYLVPHILRVVPQLLLWMKEVPEQYLLVEGDQDDGVQQYLVPIAIRKVLQLLV